MYVSEILRAKDHCLNHLNQKHFQISVQSKLHIPEQILFLNKDLQILEDNKGYLTEKMQTASTKTIQNVYHFPD